MRLNAAGNPVVEKKGPVHSLARTLTLTAGILVCAGVTLPAQWRDVVTRGVPMTPTGAPNYRAPAPKLADGKTPDLSGIWDAEKRPCDEAKARLGCLDALFGIPVAVGNIATGDKEVLPMQPWAEALVKHRREGLGKDDPTARCHPLPSPRAWSNFLNQKIIQTPESLTILDEYMAQYRQIFLDGRALPTDPEPSFKGYSVGSWERDTLVVETIGFKEDLWLDGWGHPLTSRGRTIERIRRVNYGSLEVELTVDDPTAYTKPWTVTIRLALVLDTDLLEYICNENEKSSPHLVGAGGAK
jgi:hypothetical protein